MSQKFERAVGSVLQRLMAMSDDEFEKKTKENRESEVAQLLLNAGGICKPANFMEREMPFDNHHLVYRTSKTMKCSSQAKQIQEHQRYAAYHPADDMKLAA